MTYIFQVITKDPALQLKTEVTAQSIPQLNMLSKDMVKKYPEIVGMKYIVAQYKQKNGKLVATTLKTDVINGS